MNINTFLRTLYKKGDYSKKREAYHTIDVDAAFERFTKRIESEGSANRPSSVGDPVGKSVGMRRRYQRYASIAASILLPVAVTMAVYLYGGESESSFISEVQPGTSLAYIETSSGEIFTLDSTVAHINMNGVRAAAMNGELAVDATDEPEMVSVCIPRGGEYKLVLPDGSRVILNSDSKISFPTCFTGDSRDVSLVGEAYFEVSHSDSHPFIVHLGDVTVKQYGTHFNINAYPGQEKVVTLVEGSIGVAMPNKTECRLSPGKMACVKGDDIKVCSTDVELALSWTEGMFRFDDVPLSEISSTLSRWYNADIFVDVSLRDRRFTGSLSRKSLLTDILSAICDITNTHYSVEGEAIKIYN